MTVVTFPQRLRLADWQTLAVERMHPLYAEEIERWQRLFEWDTEARWREIEARRRQGLAAGLVVVDDAGQVSGWCHYAVRDRVMRIDTFSARQEQAAEMMLERLLSPSALTYVERVSALLFSNLPGLPQTLRAHGLTVDRYWYLARDLSPVAPPALPSIRRWRPEDSLATVALLGRAYDPSVETRPFAPLGTPEQWMDYLAGINRGVQGALLPEASFCLPAGPDKLAAVVLVTRIGESSAHLAQLVVDPAARRRRIGQQLMEMASAAAARAGCRRLTALVGGSNRPGRSLFETARYHATGSLLAAGTLQPRRATTAGQRAAGVVRR